MKKKEVKKIVNIKELQKRFLPFTPGFVILNFNSLFFLKKSLHQNFGYDKNSI